MTPSQGTAETDPIHRGEIMEFKPCKGMEIQNRMLLKRWTLIPVVVSATSKAVAMMNGRLNG